MACVELMPDVVDYGDVQSLIVTGCHRIDWPSPGIVTLGFYREHRGHDGSIDRRPAFEIVLDAAHASPLMATILQALDEMFAGHALRQASVMRDGVH